MARIATVLAAIQRLAWRDMQSLLSIPGNNLFAFAVLLAKQPESVEFFILFVVMAALTVFSEDPAKKVAARLSLWPLGFRQRLAIRMAALMMTPAFLLAAGTSIVTQHANVALSLVGGTLGLQAARSLFVRLRLQNGAWPCGVLPTSLAPSATAVAVLQIRQMLMTLDTYLAVVLALGGFWYCAQPASDLAAASGLAMLIVLTLSTQTQILFGHDGAGGMTRYRLWPVAGRRILLMKGLGVLAVTAILVLPLDPVVGLSAMLASLSIGHHGSLFGAPFQRRWRFASGRVLLVGILQIAAIFSVGSLVRTAGWLVLAAAGLVWMVSLVVYGRAWDRANAHD
jgi:hypothetical protein